MTIAARPNITWSHEAKGEPPPFYRDGRDQIAIPAPAVAKSGFHSPDPARLIRLSGGKFKHFVPKDETAFRVTRKSTKQKRGR
jgi:hypothetical protein